MNDSMPPAGQSPGALLKKSREARGISLDEASHVTKIGKIYLAAIEDDRFTSLPNPAYVKGFLRSYASFLSLSPDEIVRLYDQSQLPEPAEVESEPSPANKPRQPFAYAAVAAVVVVAAIGYIAGQYEKEPRPKPVAPAPVRQPAAQVVQPRLTTARTPTAAAGGETKDEPGAPTRGGRDKSLFLRMKVNENARLYIDIDGTASQEYELNAGDLIEWKGDSYFVIDIDNGGAVDVEYNGRKLPPLGPPGAPAHVVLRREPTTETQNQGEH